MPHKNGNSAALEINKEITSVYEYCLAAGLTHEEILEKARPLLQPFPIGNWKKTFFAVLKSILKIGICCLALSYTLSSDTISKSMLSHGRHFMFKILNVWDWTTIYSETCLVDNPFYSNEQIYEVDCQTCEDAFNIDYLNRTTAQEISEMYLQRNIPVIVKDATVDWPIMKDTFSILNLTNEFRKSKKDVCRFETNLPVQNHLKLFEQILDPNAEKWYVHWENCDTSTQKLVRKFYTRPYFLPSTLQMSQSNWVIMSYDYSGKKFEKIDPKPSVTVMWVAQVWGYNRIKFQPKQPCDKSCHTIEDTLEEGEIVLFSPTIWSFSYVPGDETENLAIAAGGFSDIA